MSKAVKRLYDCIKSAFDEYAMGDPATLWDGAGSFAAATLPILQAIINNGLIDIEHADALIITALGEPPNDEIDVSVKGQEK